MSSDAVENGSGDDDHAVAMRSLRHVGRLIAIAPYVTALSVVTFVVTLPFVSRSIGLWVTAVVLPFIAFPLFWRYWHTRSRGLFAWLWIGFFIVWFAAPDIFLGEHHSFLGNVQFASLWCFTTFGLVLLFRRRLRVSLSRAIV